MRKHKEKEEESTEGKQERAHNGEKKAEEFFSYFYEET